jgi:uncharacterized protein
MPVSSYILIKLASRCNLNCSYCYWFKDRSVYEKPVTMEDSVVNAFIEKLQHHILINKVPEFLCIFHGGEPLLYEVAKFESFLLKLEKVQLSTGCKISYSITTNGVLINDAWAKLFKRYNVTIAVSIDGPEDIHDIYRKDFKNKGSYKQVVEGFEKLKRYNLTPGIIAVCNPKTDPIRVLEHFVNVLGVKHFTILLPDANYDSRVESVANYYIQLFDYWYENYMELGIEVKFLNSLIRVVLGLDSRSDSFGYGPVHTVSLLTDGSLEPLDVLRIAGYRSTKTKYNIMHHQIADVREDSGWKNAYESSLNLCETCSNCEYKNPCGGGHISQRWSKLNGYNNPSVYCNDFKKIIQHVIDKISNDMSMVEATVK